MSLVFRPLLLFHEPPQMHSGQGDTDHGVTLLCIMRRVSYDGPCHHVRFEFEFHFPCN